MIHESGSGDVKFFLSMNNLCSNLLEEPTNYFHTENYISYRDNKQKKSSFEIEMRILLILFMELSKVC